VFVSRSRVAVAIGAVLLWAVTPVLACLLPCLAMAPAKQECSHHMAMHCGHSMVAAGRTCCQMSSHPGFTTVETPVNKLQKRALAVVPVVGHFSPPEVTPRPTSLAFLESPPQEGPPLSSSVLRI
jgi:hypothetical protein